MADWHEEQPGELACRSLDLDVNGDIIACRSCGKVGSGMPRLDTQSLSRYKAKFYAGLKERTHMRLLTLEPGWRNDVGPIRCSMDLVDASTDPDYCAMSYTWAGENNDMAETSLVVVNGRVFPVTANCEAALRSARSEGYPRGIWIDAICINQADDNEKNHQVRLMSRIYQRASNVLIYAGELSPELKRIFYCLRCRKILNSLQLKPLRKFFSRRYFYRAWILQEIALAKSAQVIGDDQWLPWSLLEKSTQSTLHRSSVARRCPALRPGIHLYHDASNLLHLLDTVRYSHATNPKDKIFSIYGLISCADNEGLVADYTKSTKQTFMEMAQWIAERFGLPAMLARSTLVLCHPDNYLTRDDRIPTWVPNWAEVPHTDWTDRICPQSGATVNEETQHERRLPVEVNLDAGTIGFPAFKVGKLVDHFNSHRTKAECYPSGHLIWSSRARYSMPEGPGEKSMVFEEDIEFLQGRLGSSTGPYSDIMHEFNKTEHHDDSIYLVPEPGTYNERLFSNPDELDEVVIRSGSEYFAWGKKRSERSREGILSKYAVCGTDLGEGRIRLSGLLKLPFIVHSGTGVVGHFETIKIVDGGLVS